MHNILPLQTTAQPQTAWSTENGSHEKEAKVLTEHAAGKLLAAHPAPHLTVHDLESAMLITAAAAAVSMRNSQCRTLRRQSTSPLLQLPSA